MLKMEHALTSGDLMFRGIKFRRLGSMVFAHPFLNMKIKARCDILARASFVSHSIKITSQPWQGHISVYIFMIAIVSLTTDS